MTNSYLTVLREFRRNCKSFFLFLLLAASLLVMGCSNPASGTGGSNGDAGSGWDGEYNVGDTGPAGGLIFYVDVAGDYPNWTYLESAPSTWSVSAEGTGLAWLTERTDVASPGFESLTGIGTGKENTEGILALTNGSYPAAEAADNYSVTQDGTTYDDWFLPSPRELDEMYQALHLQGKGGFSTADNTPSNPNDDEVMYWSSYADMGSLFSVNFILPESTRGSNFSQWTIGWLGDQTFYVRPARRF